VHFELKTALLVIASLKRSTYPLAGSWGRWVKGEMEWGKGAGEKKRRKEVGAKERGYPSPNENPAYGPE